MKKIMFTMLAVVALGSTLYGVNVPVPTTATYPPPGDVLVGSKSVAFGGGAESGTLLSQVWEPAGGGTLTFIYKLSNTSAVGGESFSRLSIGGFLGFLPVLSQTLAAAGEVAADNGSISGTGTVGFNFGSLTVQIAPGESSTYLFVSTSAGTFASHLAAVQDATSFNVGSFAPSGVPDGGSAVALLGIALAGIEGVRRFVGARKA